MPALNIPGDPGDPLIPSAIWYVTMGAAHRRLCACCGLRPGSRFGRVVVAIRENETRAMLLGYDRAALQAADLRHLGRHRRAWRAASTINWGGFISPTIFGLPMSAEVIIFVLVGGLGTLVGPILGGVGLQYLITLAGTQEVVNPNLGLGIVLVGFVLLVPQGVVPLIRDRLLQCRPAARTRQAAAVQETAS